MTLTISHMTGVTEPPVRDITIGHLLREAAAAVPDRLAMLEGITNPDARREWTYAELLGEAEQCARGLLARFEPGDRIAVWAHNIPEWVILEYGCALAGMILVTVNPAFRSHERLGWLIDDAAG
ncbi:MAG: AMP-binding protein, partial [Actinomycetia bacterium]|nr:AMP-binding protein [Actinomycetes bacterium]